MRWVCIMNPKHVFDTEPEDELMECPECKKENKFGILSQRDAVEIEYENELGLCVLLMDASISMVQHKVPPTKKTRLEVIAETAAQGIFDLQGTTKSQETYICIMAFSKNVKILLLNSLHNILEKFDYNFERFASFLKAEMSQMGQDTNINGALNAAYLLVDDFLNKKLSTFGDYDILYHVLLDHNMEEVKVPNVRVLLYTDGRHNVPISTDPIVNPFKSMNPDILIGVFIGNDKVGKNKLQKNLSNCPDHNFPQFFHFDQSEKTDTLRKIFRMASGTSGFCVQCLGQP